VQCGVVHTWYLVFELICSRECYHLCLMKSVHTKTLFLITFVNTCMPTCM
jgi:hypothetical protein